MNEATSGEHVQEPVAALIATLIAGGIDTLRTAANGCPACMLATILQERVQRGVHLKQLGPEDAAEEWNRHGEFDYTAERKGWWEAVNIKLEF